MASYLVEVLAVFVGVALAFWVENARESRRDRSLGRAYLHGFAADFRRDLKELRRVTEFRMRQAASASTALEFFSGRSMDVEIFFGAFYSVLPNQAFVPSRNTMDEVLNAGHLHLVEDVDRRGAILDLYTLYGRIDATQHHIEQDYRSYLYDPAFSVITLDPDGTEVSALTRQSDGERLLGSTTVGNGLRLVIYNVRHVLLPNLREAEDRVHALLSGLT